MTSDEIGMLARICDSALKRLSDALEREKAFTADVSHELRTPLMVIGTSAELLELSQLDERQRRQVERIMNAQESMKNLVELFLQLARKVTCVTRCAPRLAPRVFLIQRKAMTP